MKKILQLAVIGLCFSCSTYSFALSDKGLNNYVRVDRIRVCSFWSWTTGGNYVCSSSPSSYAIANAYDLTRAIDSLESKIESLEKRIEALERTPTTP